MILLLIRHGKAEEGAGKADADRVLTEDGRKECRQFFRALHAYVGQLSHIISSPLVRAQETADILAEFSPTAMRAQSEELSPWSDPAELNFLLRQLVENHKLSGGASSQTYCALVSHEPYLSQTTSYLLTGETRPILEVRKGGVSILEYQGPTWGGGFCLQAHLFPKFYRSLVSR